MIDIKAIREAAEAATPGPWQAVARTNACVEVEAYMQQSYAARKVASLSLVRHEENALFIATANPATVLALCDEVEKLRKDAARYQWLKRERVNENYEGDLRIEFECGFDHYNDIDKSIDAAMGAKP